MSENVYGTLSEEQKTVSIPYYLHEGEMYRLERLNKRWFIAFLIVLVMLFVTNAGWVIYESQYETYSYEQEATYETAVTTSVLNNGTGRVVFNGNESETSSSDSGQETEQQEPDQTMPQV